MTTSALRESFAGNTPSGAQLPPLDLSGVLGTLPDRIARASKTFFLAPLAVINLAAGATATAQYRADSSHDFVGYLATYSVRNNGTKALIVDPNVLIRLTDEQARSFSPTGAAGQVELRNFAGAAASTPGILPVPVIVAAGTAFNAEFQNNEAVNVDVRVALIGFLAGKVA